MLDMQPAFIVVSTPKVSCARPGRSGAVVTAVELGHIVHLLR